MTPPDPLAQLHPLREPAAIGWWPPAPGWWLLLALLLIALAALGWLWLRHHRRNAYRRQGLAALVRIREQWQADQDHRRCLTETNALLKAVALQAYPQHDIAGISGRDWQGFLNRASAGQPRFEQRLLQAQYLREFDGEGLEQHLALCAGWIQGHRVNHD